VRRYRLSRLAEVDLARILTQSAERWDAQAHGRYRALLVAAMRKVASDPDGPTTRSRDEVAPAVRSFHIRHARDHAPQAEVRRPVHVLYYRVLGREVIEIIRVLHERMEPSRHLGPRL
jgi:toxin ParE1/3/4